MVSFETKTKVNSKYATICTLTGSFLGVVCSSSWENKKISHIKPNPLGKNPSAFSVLVSISSCYNTCFALYPMSKALQS